MLFRAVTVTAVIRQKKPRFRGSWHGIPKKTRAQWLARLGLTGATKHKAVCSRHFRDDDFHVPPMMAERMGFQTCQNTLKPGVIPSLNLPDIDGQPEEKRFKGSTAYEVNFDNKKKKQKSIEYV